VGTLVKKCVVKKNDEAISSETGENLEGVGQNADGAMEGVQQTKEERRIE